MKLKNIKGINLRYCFIINKELTMSESFLLSLFLDINISDGIPSNDELSKFMSVTKSSISKNIGSLIKKGFLDKEINLSDREIFELLSKGNIIWNGCMFCGYSKSTLDKHHYPKRSKDGGTQTIPLCPNCHREFHELADHNRKLIITDKTKRLDNE